MSPTIQTAPPVGQDFHKSHGPDSAPVVVLAGNPNCGKTTIFNALTGLRYKVANYPGVTVEKKSGRLHLADNLDATLVDLPGIYSFSGSSLDERIAADAFLGKVSGERRPNLIVCVVDASNLERNLYLVTQLLDLELPVLLALNMIDIATSHGISIKKEILSRLLDVPVVALTGHKKEGIEELRRAIQDLLSNPRQSNRARAWLEELPEAQKVSQEIGLEDLGADTATNADGFLRGLELISESRQPGPDVKKEGLNISRTTLSKLGLDPFSFEATYRYKFINAVFKKSVSLAPKEGRYTSERVDAFITHRFWGSLVFILIMTTIFQSIFLWAKLPMDFINETFSQFGDFVGSLLPEGRLKSLVVDGIISGVGSVVVFIPQIGLLFFFLGLLEDSGYLSRAAFLMDRLMRKVGLQGRAFIPLLSSFACAIPGIMSTRTIPSFADRMTTIMIAPLMSCSARLPVYTLLIAACIPSGYFWGVFSVQGLTLLSMYLLGVAGAAVVAWLLKLSVLRGEPALFVMEMPPLRFPSLVIALREALDRIIIFLKSAGTVILACTVILWALASYPGDTVKESFAGKIGTFVEPAIAPLGFNWEIGVGILASFAAREVFISSLATVYNLESTNEASTSVLSALKERSAQGTFSISTALALMVFYVFCCQCMSTLAICKRETGSWRWTAFMFIYMTTLAYIAAFLAYHVSSKFLGT